MDKPMEIYAVTKILISNQLSNKYRIFKLFLKLIMTFDRRGCVVSVLRAVRNLVLYLNNNNKSRALKNDNNYNTLED